MDIQELIGSWNTVAARLDATGAIGRWAALEPVLVGVPSVTDLAAATGRGAPPARADEVLAALVRIGAVDGGDDRDAAIVLLHLLTPGVLRLAGLLRCELVTVVGELWCQIRSHPWRRRRRGFSAGLLLDTKAALLRESRPREREVPVEPFDPVMTRGQPVAELDVHDRVDLAALVKDVLRSGTATEDDLALLIELELGWRYGAGTTRHLAEDRGICTRTVRRRRMATVAALRTVAERRPGAVA